jgi:hypothetical protein
MMKVKGFEPTSVGLATMYSDIIGTLVIHTKDGNQISEIKKEGINVV